MCEGIVLICMYSGSGRCALQLLPATSGSFSKMSVAMINATCITGMLSITL